MVTEHQFQNSTAPAIQAYPSINERCQRTDRQDQRNQMIFGALGRDAAGVDRSGIASRTDGLADEVKADRDRQEQDGFDCGDSLLNHRNSP
jgi:hypothetical protein